MARLKYFVAAVTLLCIYCIGVLFKSNDLVPISLTAHHHDANNVPDNETVAAVYDDDGHLDPMFADRPFTFYTISYHATPVADLRNFLGPMGVHIVDMGVNVYMCGHFNSCLNGLPSKPVKVVVIMLIKFVDCQSDSSKLHWKMAIMTLIMSHGYDSDALALVRNKFKSNCQKCVSI